MLFYKLIFCIVCGVNVLYVILYYLHLWGEREITLF